MSYGPLPFNRRAVLKTRPNTVVNDSLPVSIWPTTTRTTQAGLTYDHQGEAPVTSYDELRGPNLVLVLDGEEYMVIDCEQNVYLPHTALMLRRSRPAGA